MSLDGKVCIVTGSATGIGAASATLLAQKGAKVVGGDVNEEEGNKVVASIKSEGGEALFVKCDVAVQEDAERLVSETVDAYGKLDVIFANAGINPNEGNVVDMDVDVWRKTQAINVDGVFFACRAAIPALRKNGGGSIIVTASPSSFMGWPGNAAYICSKGAAMGLVRAMAMDHAKENIRVNAVIPGLIMSPLGQEWLKSQPDPDDVRENFHPVGRLGEPEDVAPVVAYLASDESAFSTGSPFFVDGGLVAG
jgi:meso-butanediol dehydrogenase / (S,S)-butanediol dehydrogenase / diacetyl reductase